MEQRKAAKEAVEKALRQIHELESLVSDFDGNQATLQTKLDDYVASLKAIHATGSALERRPGMPFELPVELLKYLDDGGNPDVFITDVLRSAAAANQAAKGKVEAFRLLKTCVAEDMEAAHPELMAAYNALRKEQKPAAGTG